jgi:hypothetical protein
VTHLRNTLAYLDVPTLAQPKAYIQMKEGLFDADGERFFCDLSKLGQILFAILDMPKGSKSPRHIKKNRQQKGDWQTRATGRRSRPRNPSVSILSESNPTVKEIGRQP